LQLEARPTLKADTLAAIATTEALFIEHGAPLVLESDNGSPFEEVWHSRPRLC
jgi:hypothetical protein